MKKYIFLIAAALSALTGCKAESPETQETPLSELVCGEWRGTELSVDGGVYILIASDGTFELYQKLDTETYESRRGEWSLNGTTLSGTYNDSEPWAASYTVTVNGDILTLVAQNDSGETNVYRRTDIPDYIKESAAVIVRSLPYAY